MKAAYIDLIRYAIKQGHTVDLFDGEEWSIRNSKNSAKVIAEVKELEDAIVVFRDPAGREAGRAQVTAYDVSPDETVIDYTITPLMTSWEKTQDWVA